MTDISEHDRQAIERMIGSAFPGAEVWAFGSRVTGKARPWSDLDLTVFAAPDVWAEERNAAFSHLREMLDDSDVPFRVDVLDWQTLPEHHRRNIRSFYEVFIPAGQRT